MRDNRYWYNQEWVNGYILKSYHFLERKIKVCYFYEHDWSTIIKSLGLKVNIWQSIHDLPNKVGKSYHENGGVSEKDKYQGKEKNNKGLNPGSS